MAVKITYFVHGTTTDNEKGKATGWNPGKLSKLGIQQSKELKELIKGRKFDLVFCSDLKRAVDSIKLAFKDSILIVEDKRLRESNYGNLNGADEEEVVYLEHIDKPFPKGESLKDVEKRIRSFLKDLLKNYDNTHAAIMAHKSPQLALEVVLNGKTWERVIKEDWRLKKAWQPGWDYELSEDKLK